MRLHDHMIAKLMEYYILGEGGNPMDGYQRQRRMELRWKFAAWGKYLDVHL